eukprot:GHRR01014953.1.p1 GENE.GHRR01014953.1~~GHRR01014953.1.p1  ORF type:complete len:127 (+),score=30.24 GHRR01014953.1:233-613(+)
MLNAMPAKCKACGVPRQHAPASAANTPLLRRQLGRQFPNALLLPDSKLPCLYGSKHFLNLTNGLELAPLLEEWQLPFSVVRIRSTSLEQQSFEKLVLELDANFLLTLALGHSQFGNLPDLSSLHTT